MEQTKLPTVNAVFNEYEKKRKFQKNILMFIIGIILLGLEWNYLEAHVAEKQSLISGVEILYQKIQVFLYGGQILDEKYRLERNYREILDVLSTNKCTNQEDYKLVQKISQELEKLDINNYKLQKNKYISLLNTYINLLNQKCQ